MEKDKFDALILLDDNAYGKAREFIKDGGLTFLKSKFGVEKVVAAIGVGGTRQLAVFQSSSVQRGVTKLKPPTEKEFPVETAEKILELASGDQGGEEMSGRMLMLCDWQWILADNQQMENALDKIVAGFEKAQCKANSNDGEKNYEELVIVFYTATMEHVMDIPNGRGNVKIMQKAAVEWHWDDPESAVFRVKELFRRADTAQSKRKE